jgi:hypothetical protein
MMTRHIESKRVWVFNVIGLLQALYIQGIHKRMVRFVCEFTYKPHHYFVYALYFVVFKLYVTELNRQSVK